MSETKQWSTSAGPLQTKRVVQSLEHIRTEGRSYTEKSGVVGVDEHEFNYMAIFGGMREDCKAALSALGEKFKWEISAGNMKEIIAAADAALVELRKNRPVKDNRRTPEQEAERVAQIKKVDEERQAKENEKRQKVEALLPGLRAKYPWAVPAIEGKSRNARVGQNIRTDLERTFPGVPFSVRTEHNSVRVSWQFGPTTQEVDAVLAKFKDGQFDGQTDSYDHDHSPMGEALQIVLGRLSYLSVSRDFPPESYSQVSKLICEAHGKVYTGPDMRGALGEDDGETVSQHAWHTLAQTSFPYGSEIAGLVDPRSKWESFAEQMLNTYGQGFASAEGRAKMTPEHLSQLEAQEQDVQANGNQISPFKIILQAGKPATPTTKAPAGVSVAYNAEHDGVEIRFTAKPGPDVILNCKRHGFRWSVRSHVWYKKFTPMVWAKAHELAGLDEAPLPKQQETPDRFDMAVEDRMAEACGL